MLEYKTMSMCVGSDYCRGWNDAVAEMPKWISVKERMPPKGEKVLLYIPEREGCKQHGMYLGEVEKVEADPKGEHNFWGLPMSNLICLIIGRAEAQETKGGLDDGR